MQEARKGFGRSNVRFDPRSLDFIEDRRDLVSNWCYAIPCMDQILGQVVSWSGGENKSRMRREEFFVADNPEAGVMAQCGQQDRIGVVSKILQIQFAANGIDEARAQPGLGIIRQLEERVM